MELEPYEASLGLLLRHWARETPDRVFLAERDGDGDWVELTWGEAARKANAIAQALIDRGLGAQRPVMLLSGNAIDHALLTLGGFLAGVPVVPVSPAYSLMSQDYGKVKHIAALVKPGLVYAADAGPFGGVLAAVDFGGAELVLSRGNGATRLRRAAVATRPPMAVEDGAGARSARQRGQDPVHLGLDRDAQGRDQHARDAVREPAVARADLAVHRRHAAGARGLAAVEPHVRRQPQLQPDPQARRDAVHRRRPARRRR